MNALDPLRGAGQRAAMGADRAARVEHRGDAIDARAIHERRTFEVASAGVPASAASGAASAVSERTEMVRAGLREGCSLDALVERLVQRELDQQFGPAAASTLPADLREAVVAQFKADPTFAALVQGVIADAAPTA